MLSHALDAIVTRHNTLQQPYCIHWRPFSCNQLMDFLVGNLSSSFTFFHAYLKNKKIYMNTYKVLIWLDSLFPLLLIRYCISYITTIIIWKSLLNPWFHGRLLTFIIPLSIYLYKSIFIPSHKFFFSWIKIFLIIFLIL